LVTQENTPNEAVNRKKAGKIWGVSEGLVIKLDRLGLIRTIKIGKLKRVPPDEIERVLREGVKSGIVSCLVLLPLSISAPLAKVIGFVWQGFRHA